MPVKHNAAAQTRSNLPTGTATAIPQIHPTQPNASPNLRTHKNREHANSQQTRSRTSHVKSLIKRPRNEKHVSSSSTSSALIRPSRRYSMSLTLNADPDLKIPFHPRGRTNTAKLKTPHFTQRKRQKTPPVLSSTTKSPKTRKRGSLGPATAIPLWRQPVPAAQRSAPTTQI